MSQQDGIHTRCQYVTPGMWTSDFWHQSEDEQLLRKMNPEREAIAMQVSKCAGKRRPK